MMPGGGMLAIVRKHTIDKLKRGVKRALGQKSIARKRWFAFAEIRLEFECYAVRRIHVVNQVDVCYNY